MKQFTMMEALLMMATNEFAPFSSDDWNCFAGCNSEHPLICYTKEFVLIIDEDCFVIAGNTDETCEDEHQVFRVTKEQVGAYLVTPKYVLGADSFTIRASSVEDAVSHAKKRVELEGWHYLNGWEVLQEVGTFEDHNN